MLGLPPPEGGGILSDAMALRAAMRRRKPEKLRSVVARSRSASLLPPQTERSLALAASERTLPERSLALSRPPSSERRLAAPARSRPPPSERSRPSERAPTAADALLSRSWTAAMPKLSELALESRAPTPSSARFLPRASSGGDDASLVAGLVGSTRDAFLRRNPTTPTTRATGPSTRSRTTCRTRGAPSPRARASARPRRGRRRTRPPRSSARRRGRGRRSGGGPAAGRPSSSRRRWTASGCAATASTRGCGEK